MSFDLAVWFPDTELDHEQADTLYGKLCDGDTFSVVPNTALSDFYRELTAKHPEIDDIPESEIANSELCPWSVAFDRSPGHLILCSVWSKAEYVRDYVATLARKHGLAVYDPQDERIHYPFDSPFFRRSIRRPWGGLLGSLKRLIGRTDSDAFVIVEDEVTEKFVQFGRGPSLVLDLPQSETFTWGARPISIVVRGNVAVVHYIASAHFSNENGAHTNREQRWTDTLIKENGRWFLLADQGGSTDALND